MRRYLLLFVALSVLIVVPGVVAQARKPPVSKAAQKKASAQSATTHSSSDGSDPAAPVKEDLKRLVLNDGSYQSVIKYQLIGDRVHYLSAERFEWEDIPASLINWDASRKFAADAAAENVRAREVDAQAKKEQEEEDANTPTVSPGIKLPQTGGIYLLDVYQNRPELNELSQNGADVKKNTAGNIFRAAINPIASAKQTIELTGPHAKVQSHVGDPFIYVALDQGEDAPYSPDPTRQQDHWRIVKLHEKKGNRLVGNLNIAIYGKVKENAEYMDAQVTPVSGPWIKISPSQPLPPGEYALVEMLGQGGINRFVWDFGVNPNAAANAGVWRAQPVKRDTTGQKEPSIETRKP
jgi:hypothetical protein